MRLDVKAIRNHAVRANADGKESHPQQVMALCDRVEALEKALDGMLMTFEHEEDCLVDHPGFLCACVCGDAQKVLDGE